MKHLALFSVVLGVLLVISSCGTEPSDSGTTTSDLKYFHNNNHSYSTPLQESFDDYTTGSGMPDKYKWVSGGKASSKVTNATARQKNKKSLQISISQGGTDYLGSQFCLNKTASKYLRATFSVNFANFVNWTGFGISDGTTMQYYWWIRLDGTVFDETTFDSFTQNAWQDVQIVVDRDQNLATLTIAGRTHYAELDQVWPATDPASTMKCLFLFVGTMGGEQNVYIDDIKVRGY
jgi:glycine cleavage system aminomethyltransferase T